MPANPFNDYTDYGIGIGLRVPHYRHILEKKPVVDWFEIISENFMVDGGRPLEVLDSILEQYRVVQHGVAIYFGSADKLNREHLKKLKRLVKRTNTLWLSDHLCWGSVDGRYTHDLLPMPYTFAAARVTAQKIREARDFLEVPICVENVSSYAEFHASEMTEWEFLSEVVEQADCGILLDVNNIYVSSKNHNFDPYDYLDNIPHHRVGQIHIAGHSKFEKYILDTHDHPVLDPVWKMYAHAIRKIGRTATLLEWDDRIPSFDEVHNEALKALKFQEQQLAAPVALEFTHGPISSICNAAMAGAIFRPLTARWRMQSKSDDGRNLRAEAAEFIKPNDRLSSFERLEIYNRQYWFRLLDCLYDDYPGLHAVLGDRKFLKLATAYLARYPSDSFALRDLGSRLERFLPEEPELSAPREALALDMARFEWAQVVAFDGLAKPPITTDEILDTPPGKLRLGLQPYLSILTLRYAVDDFLIALKKGSTDGLRAEASNAVESGPKASRRKKKPSPAGSRRHSPRRAPPRQPALLTSVLNLKHSKSSPPLAAA